MRAYELLPDPAALGGDQPRGRRGAARGDARRDDLALCLSADRGEGAPLGGGALMSAPVPSQINALNEGYKYGFVTEIETEEAPPGLNEDTVRFISAKKG